MIVSNDHVVHASEATRNAAGDASSHSLGPDGRTSIQIQMEPDAAKPDLTSYEVIKPENPNFFLDPPTPSVFVGPEMIKFVVFQHMICRFSTFFRDAFANATDTAYITLPDVEPKTFDVFVKWAIMATCSFPKLDCLTGGPRVVSFFDLVKLYVFAQSYNIRAVQDSVVSTIYGRLSDDRESWATLGSDVGLLEYLVGHIDSSTGLYTLITRSLAYHMFPAPTSQQEVRMPSADGQRPATSVGRGLPQIFPPMNREIAFHELAKMQADHRQAMDAYRKAPSEEADMNEIMTTVPDALLRDIVKEFFRMKSYALSASMDFKACVGSDSDFHLPHSAL